MWKREIRTDNIVSVTPKTVWPFRINNVELRPNVSVSTFRFNFLFFILLILYYFLASQLNNNRAHLLFHLRFPDNFFKPSTWWIQTTKIKAVRSRDVLKLDIRHWYLGSYQSKWDTQGDSMENFIKMRRPNPSNNWIKICFLFTKLCVLCRKRSESMDIDH